MGHAFCRRFSYVLWVTLMNMLVGILMVSMGCIYYHQEREFLTEKEFIKKAPEKSHFNV